MKDENFKGGFFHGDRVQPRLLDVRSGCEVSRETDEQIALFEWARWSANLMQHTHIKEALALTWIFAVPNGLWLPGTKAQAIRIIEKAKRAGLTPGVFDIFLPYPTELYAGLWIEMKAGKNTLTPEQKQFNEAIFLLRYQTVIAYSWREAARGIVQYLSLDQKKARYTPIPGA